MTTYLSKEVREGLELARKRALRKKSRLRVGVGEARFAVLEYREGGFALDIDDAPKLRGLVDLYDGTRQLMQCLVVASEEDGHLMRYEFKRATPIADHAPLDFARDEDAPVALIAYQ
jgi:hypothetical protein